MSELTPQTENLQGPCCAHLRVVWRTEAVEQGVRGWWACDSCKRVFYPSGDTGAEQAAVLLRAEIERLHGESAHRLTMYEKRQAELSVVVVEYERLRAALQSIAEHNHDPVDAHGNVVILQSDCPACTPTRTARAALSGDSPPADETFSKSPGDCKHERASVKCPDCGIDFIGTFTLQEDKADLLSMAALIARLGREDTYHVSAELLTRASAVLVALADSRPPAQETKPECQHPVESLFYHGFVSGKAGEYRCNICDTILYLPQIHPRDVAADRVENSSQKASAGPFYEVSIEHPDYCHEHDGHLVGSPACELARERASK